MKKALLCALLALLLVLSCTVCVPAALAQSVCSCACGAVSDGVSAGPDGEADPLDPFILTRPKPEDPLSALEYTQEIDTGNYRVYVPSISIVSQGYDGYSCYLDDLSAFIVIGYENAISWIDSVSYTDIDDCRGVLDDLAYPDDYLPVHVDESIGALVLKQDGRYLKACLYATNRKQSLQITIYTLTEEHARKLMAGILEHIVAPIQTCE